MLPRVEVAPEALAKVPADLAQEVGALPFALEDNRLRVAFHDPLDALAIEEIEDSSDCIVEPYQALGRELQWAIATHYPELGLAPPADFEVDTDQRLGTLAVDKGLLSEAALRQAVEEQSRTGGLLGRILIKQGFLTEETLAQLLAEQVGIPFVKSLTDAKITEKLALTLLRLDAVQFNAVPYKEEEHLVIALADPRRIPDIESIIQRPLSFVCAPESAVQERIEKMYAGDKGRLGETLLQSKKTQARAAS